MSIKTVLPQIEEKVNSYLTYSIGDDHSKIKYFEVSPYTKSKKKKELLESGERGVPVKLAVAALDGFSPLDTLSMDYFENTLLKLHESWVPFSISYTQSSSGTDPVTGGRPQQDDITPEGEKSRSKDGSNT